MSCCCFSCCQQTLLSVNLSILGGFFSHLFSLLSSRFSRCFSTRESANPVAAQLRHRWRATLPRPKATLRSSSRRVFSHRNASASNKCKPCCSAVVACLLQMLLLNLHVMFVVIVLLFNFLYNADESFKDMDPLASGRRSHTLAGTVHCW